MTGAGKMAGEDRPMAMHEFLRNLQTARNVVFPQLPPGVTLAPPTDPLAFDMAMLRRTAPVWLSPRTVAGFDANEFESFEVKDREQLGKVVQGFLAIADAVAGRDPTDDELRSGIAYLTILVTVLDPLFLDAEGKALLLALYRSSILFPGFVLGLDYDLDNDWSGAPGVWISVIVPDDVDPDSDEFIRFSREFRKDVWRALREAKSDRQPYIQFRSLSETLGTVVNEEGA